MLWKGGDPKAGNGSRVTLFAFTLLSKSAQALRLTAVSGTECYVECADF